MVKVSEKGQITIPKEYREKFGIRPGDEVEFGVEEDHLVVKRKATEFEDYAGYLGESDETVDERLDELRGEKPTR
ncbi:MAG: AbrB/MazE/SpoVT family DNA-binding domain-containing protein [Halobacteriales archaeon]|nr:AbrB/MazE/SpoVT family DNA-binding domain-containing protein [Halobacteriales archaeon]